MGTKRKLKLDWFVPSEDRSVKTSASLWIVSSLEILLQEKIDLLGKNVIKFFKNARVYRGDYIKKSLKPLFEK